MQSVNTVEYPINNMTTIHDEEKIKELIYSILQGNYSCSRVWEAWNYNTMSRDDFAPLEEDENIINDLFEIVKQVRLKTIDEAIGCGPRELSYMSNKAVGFNDCRNRFITNLEQLKK